MYSEDMNVSCHKKHARRHDVGRVGLFALPFQVDQRLKHFVGDRDNLRVRLEAALGDDHVRELVGDVHVGHFKSGRRDGRAKGCRRTRLAGLARVVRVLVQALADLRQAAGIREALKRDLRLYLLHAVRISTRNRTRLINGNAGQRTRRVAVRLAGNGAAG